MRIANGPLGTAFLSLALVTALAIGASPASAQCSMMGGGGHDHGSGVERTAKKSAASEKKQRQSIEKLLADDQGRQILADALLDDRDFVRSFLARLLEAPEWRALAAQSLSAGSEDRRNQDETTASALYVCPMHPEVTASRPGSCSKCGMDMVRRAPPAPAR